MGLDAVELVRRLEDAFGVELKDDEEVTDAVTPRMVIDLIFSKLKAANERLCRSQRAFHIIRRALVQTFGLPRRLVAPDMPLRDCFPESQEKVMWEEVGSALSARDWPSLVRPRWLTCLMTVCGFVSFGVTIAAVVHLSRNAVLPAVLAGLTAVGLFGFVADRLTRRFCVHIPANIQSIRDMMPYAMTSSRLDGWTRDEVAAVVRCLVIDQLGIGESEYTEDSSFSKDFRLD